MFPARLFMGLVLFVICGWMLGGIAEGQTTIISQTESNDIMKMGAYNKTTTIDTNSAGSITFFDSAWDFFDKIILFDWSVFYDIYTGYTSATCATAGGDWQSASSTCKIPNIWVNLRLALVACLGITLIITFLLLLRRLTLG